MEARTEIVAGQPSWIVENDTVRAAITQQGGHMAPVTFFRGTGEPVEPYYISPWQGELSAVPEPVLVALRGDFFCLPFGAGSTYRGVEYTTHGEPASARWDFGGLERKGPITRLALAMTTRNPAGRITKIVQLLEAHNVLYLSHVLEGYDCRTPLGHHATLAGAAEPDALLLSTSPILFGRVAPRPAGSFMQDGEYHALAAGAVFRDLAKVPTVWKELPFDSCGSFPRRRGFSDIIQVYNKPGRTPAWTAAVNPKAGWLWFSLKDSAVLPSTVLWIENHGRHAHPWNGRNCCIGLEDVCGYFACGMASSVRRNDLNDRRIPTALRLGPRRPTIVNYIQGVARVPRGFGRAASVLFEEHSVLFVGDSGKKVRVPVRHSFLASGSLG